MLREGNSQRLPTKTKLPTEIEWLLEMVSRWICDSLDRIISVAQVLNSEQMQGDIPVRRTSGLEQYSKHSSLGIAVCPNGKHVCEWIYVST